MKVRQANFGELSHHHTATLRSHSGMGEKRVRLCVLCGLCVRQRKHSAQPTSAGESTCKSLWESVDFCVPNKNHSVRENLRILRSLREKIKNTARKGKAFPDLLIQDERKE